MSESVREPAKNETIRDLFRLRSRRMLVSLGVGAVVAVPVLIWGYVGGRYEDVGAVIGIVGVAIMYGGLLYLDRTKCPKCSTRVRFQAANQCRPWGPQVNACPHCGVSFDEPYRQ
jgi:hypothetical protein